MIVFGQITDFKIKKEEKMKFDEAQRLLDKCVKAAQDAWKGHFPEFENYGDHNVQSIGVLANTLFQKCLENETIELPRLD